MEHWSNVMLIESQRQEREREMAQALRGHSEAPRSRTVAWRVWLVMAVILAGMIIWWIH